LQYPLVLLAMPILVRLTLPHPDHDPAIPEQGSAR
jgi:hypothetical protein